MSETNKPADQISAIDKAIANAQARKAMKNGTDTNATQTPGAPGEPKRPRLSDEEKAARQATKDAERASKKVERDAARDARKAAKNDEKRTPHMSKVEKAASKLPEITEAAQSTVNEITANFSAAVVASIAAHLNHFNRVNATERALNQKVATGDTVRIVSGDARYVGREAVVSKAQRIRCYVDIEGVNKPVYLFTSDVEVVTPAAVAATGT